MGDRPAGDALIESLRSPFARSLAPTGRSVPSGAPVTVNFDQGLPDPALFPVDLVRRALDEVLAEDAAGALTYFGAGGPADMRYGHLGLREAIAERMTARDGRPITPDGITLVHGSTDGLALAVRTFLGPGEGAVVEQATYRHTRNFMAATGAVVRSTPMDADGLTIDGLERTLDELAADGVPPKLLYTVPTFHAPTGTVLPLERRRAVVELARSRRLVVLEDDCYHEFGYDGPPPPTLRALDDAGLVVHSDSFSKYLAPGLRLGWLAGHPAAVDAITQVRQDFSVSQLMARAVERIVRSGALDAHVTQVRDAYRHKRDLTAALLREHCGELVGFTTPPGGFFFWLRLHDRVDLDALAAGLAARGVAVRDGSWFTGDGSGRRHLRLSPIQLDDDTIARGLALLGDALVDATTEEAR